MDNLSDKAKVVLELLNRAEATSPESKTNIYALLKILDEVDLSEILPDEEEYELDSIRCEMTQKSVSTTLAALVRRQLVEKTGVSATQVDGKMINLRGYYLAQ